MKKILSGTAETRVNPSVDVDTFVELIMEDIKPKIVPDEFENLRRILVGEVDAWCRKGIYLTPPPTVTYPLGEDYATSSFKVAFGPHYFSGIVGAWSIDGTPDYACLRIELNGKKHVINGPFAFLANPENHSLLVTLLSPSSDAGMKLLLFVRALTPEPSLFVGALEILEKEWAKGFTSTILQSPEILDILFSLEATHKKEKNQEFDPYDKRLLDRTLDDIITRLPDDLVPTDRVVEQLWHRSFLAAKSLLVALKPRAELTPTEMDIEEMHLPSLFQIILKCMRLMPENAHYPGNEENESANPFSDFFRNILGSVTSFPKKSSDVFPDYHSPLNHPHIPSQELVVTWVFEAMNVILKNDSLRPVFQRDQDLISRLLVPALICSDFSKVPNHVLEPYLNVLTVLITPDTVRWFREAGLEKVLPLILDAQSAKETVISNALAEFKASDLPGKCYALRQKDPEFDSVNDDVRIYWGQRNSDEETSWGYRVLLTDTLRALQQDDSKPVVTKLKNGKLPGEVELLIVDAQLKNAKIISTTQGLMDLCHAQ
jgi:hypothetical protein